VRAFPIAGTVSILAALACGGKSVPPGTLPSDPAAVVVAFLGAVQTNNLHDMGQFFGSDRGPVNNWMRSDEREKRLTVLESYLFHTGYEIDPQTLPGDSPELRIVRVRLKRNNCEPVVPFTVRRYQDGWLVQAINLEAAGNPRRPCP